MRSPFIAQAVGPLVPPAVPVRNAVIETPARVICVCLVLLLALVTYNPPLPILGNHTSLITVEEEMLHAMTIIKKLSFHEERSDSDSESSVFNLTISAYILSSRVCHLICCGIVIADRLVVVACAATIPVSTNIRMPLFDSVVCIAC